MFSAVLACSERCRLNKEFPAIPVERVRTTAQRMEPMHRLLIWGPRAHQYAELLAQKGYPGPIHPATTLAEALPVSVEAEILLGARIPAELLAQMPKLRWIQTPNAGVEDLVAAPVPSGVLTTRVIGLFEGYIAEWTLGYMLAHTLKLKQGLTQQGEGRWQHYFIDRLEGKRLGVAGIGSIGQGVAKRAAALGLQVVGLGRSPRGNGAVDSPFSTTYTPDQLLDFCRDLDFLAVTLPLTPETDGLFGAEALAALNPGALVLNAGRGRVVQEEALLGALRSGHLGGAVLDVFATEPLPPEHPLWTEPGVTVTPHIAGPSVPAEVADYFLQNYSRFTSGAPLVGVIDRTRGY
jgi:glyoxylate/hydroxypyruvate reductase A